MSARVPARGRPELRHVTVTLSARQAAILIAAINARDWEILADRRNMRGTRRTIFRQACRRLVEAEERSKRDFAANGGRAWRRRRTRKTCPIPECTIAGKGRPGSCDSCPDWEALR